MCDGYAGDIDNLYENDESWSKTHRLKEKLDAKALRDPRTIKEYAVRNKWERVSNILRKRYKRYGDGIKVVVNEDDGYPDW